jgi:hypothetical protein
MDKFWKNYVEREIICKYKVPNVGWLSRARKPGWVRLCGVCTPGPLHMGDRLSARIVGGEVCTGEGRRSSGGEGGETEEVVSATVRGLGSVEREGRGERETDREKPLNWERESLTFERKVRERSHVLFKFWTDTDTHILNWPNSLSLGQILSLSPGRIIGKGMGKNRKIREGKEGLND